MTRQPRTGLLLAFTTAATLAACAATAPDHNAGSGSPTRIAPAAAATVPAKVVKNTYGNYVRVTRNGQTLYCKQERDTATRMMQETCLTEAQMQAQEENTRGFMQDVQGMATAPVTSPNVR